MKEAKFGAASPISWMLSLNLRELYFQELQKGLAGHLGRNGIHVFTPQSLTAIPLAVAAWEALLNEAFMTDLVKHDYKGNMLFEIDDMADKWELTRKTVEFPKFIFGKTFNKSSGAFGDFVKIVKIRNSIIHFKHSLSVGPHAPLLDLRQRNFTYPKPKSMDCPWTMEISSTEIIRFCINTISKLVEILSKMQTEYYIQQCIPIRSNAFQEISREQVLEKFKEANVDHESLNKDIFNLQG